MKKASRFQRYIPRVADRRNSVRAFVVTVVIGMLVIFGMGLYEYYGVENEEDIKPISKPIEYKGGYPEVHRVAVLYNQGKYVDAIELADSLLHENERSDIPELHKQLADKRNATRDYELTWVKINSLVAMGHEEDAKGMLDSYMETKGPYRNDAVKLRSCIIDRD